MQHFININSTTKTDFEPNFKTAVAIIFCIGVLASAAIVLGALVAAAYLLTLTISAFAEAVTTIEHLYASSNSIVQLLMILIAGYLVARLAKFAYRSLTSSRK